MQQYDIVYIQGNPNSGSILQHQEINASIITLMHQYNYKIITSEHKNLSDVTIPKARVYIGFSRGSRYLKKLDKNSLKISIGGITGQHIHRFTNNGDEILNGDVSIESMQAHFIINEMDQNSIKILIDKFLILL